MFSINILYFMSNFTFKGDTLYRLIPSRGDRLIHHPRWSYEAIQYHGTQADTRGVRHLPIIPGIVLDSYLKVIGVRLSERTEIFLRINKKICYTAKQFLRALRHTCPGRLW